jgi:hypothetical protein
LYILCLGSAVVAPSVSRSQIDISLKSQATEWLMQDAPPNPPMKAWLDAMSMMIKEKTEKDVPVQIISSVLPSGLVEVRGIVGPNVLVWQVDYPKRKYYSMDKFTSDYMALIAKAAPLR